MAEHEPQLRQGMIVFARMVPPRGEAKWRPAVIVTPDAVIPTTSQLDLVGVTTSYFVNSPEHIPLAWRYDGRVPTRLRRPSAIAVNLRAVVNKSDVEPTGGVAGKAALAELLARLFPQ